MMKLLFISLGCDKNLVDTEVMLGILREHDFAFTDDEAEADVIVINTCCFIHDAKEESIQTILDMAQYKTENGGRCQALVVTGCLAQRYHDEIRTEIPEVDAIVGTTAFDEIATAIMSVLQGAPKDEMKSVDNLVVVKQERVITTGGYYSYLKIAEGCDKHCTYCIIPKLRGRFRSVPMEHLLKDAAYLAENGVKELILVAQETTLYGVDLYGKKSLPMLLKKLCEIDGIEWIRVLYCYPEEIDDELIRVMKEEPKICHYLDMPIQHADDAVLKRMGRRTNQQMLMDTIEHLRAEIPDICIRTTLITGFPGETQEQFEELYRFVDSMEFERLGVFPYSCEEDTAAANMEDQIADEVKEQRRNEIMELQQEISFEHAEKMIGRELMVFVEGKVADENAYAARTYMDAPGVDGMLFIQTSRELMSGDFVKVRVTGAYEYDLIGELCDESAK